MKVVKATVTKKLKLSTGVIK